MVSEQTLEHENEFQPGGVTTVAAGHAVHDSYTAFLQPLLPIIKANLLLSNTQIGLLRIFLQSPSILQPVIGLVADRVGLRYLVILAPTITAGVMSFLGISSSYALIAFLLVIAGLSSASIHAVGPAIVGNLSGKSLGKGLSYWMVGGELGRTIGPVLIAFTIKYFGVEGTPWLMSLAIIASILLFIRLRDTHVEPLNNNKTLDIRNALKRMAPVILPLLGIVAASSMLIASINTFITIHLTESGADTFFASIAYAVLEAAGVIGVLFSGTISDKVGRRKVLLIAFTLSPLFTVSFLFTNGFAQVLSLIGLGLTILSTAPAMMAATQESYPENRALANGIYLGLLFILRAAAVLLVGRISDQIGLTLTFLIGAGVSFLSVPFIFLLPNNKSE